MTVLIVILLALPTIALLAYPIVKHRDIREQSAKRRRLRELLIEREIASSFVAETDLDYEMGKLAEEDHRNIEDSYGGKVHDLRNEILKLQGKVKRTEGKEPMDDDIEKQIRALRGATKRRNKTESTLCPQCGAKRLAGARFCSQCGAKQPEGDMR